MHSVKTAFLLSLALIFALSANAQAPSSAPANTTAICKDGTYSTATNKAEACNGHKGVHTWFVPAPQPSSVTAVMPAPIQAASVPSVPAPTPASTIPSMPTPNPGSIAGNAPKTNISDTRARLLASPPAPGGGPGLVWLNGTTQVYHCPGTDFYGRTKTGSYVSEADAKAKGAHPSRNKPCS